MIVLNELLFSCLFHKANCIRERFTNPVDGRVSAIKLTYRFTVNCEICENLHNLTYSKILYCWLHGKFNFTVHLRTFIYKKQQHFPIDLANKIVKSVLHENRLYLTCALCKACPCNGTSAWSSTFFNYKYIWFTA